MLYNFVNGPELESWQHFYLGDVKYAMLHNFMASCLRKLKRVCVCVVVISLTAFSHRTIVTKYFTWKYRTMLHFLYRRSYLFTFLLSSRFYWHIPLKSTAYFFSPTLYTATYSYSSVYPRHLSAGSHSTYSVCQSEYARSFASKPHLK